MKDKNIIIISLLMVIITVLLSINARSEPYAYILGDCDGDNYIGGSDLNSISMYLSGIPVECGYYDENGYYLMWENSTKVMDLYQDKKIDFIDYYIMQNMLSGKANPIFVNETPVHFVYNGSYWFYIDTNVSFYVFNNQSLILSYNNTNNNFVFNNYSFVINNGDINITNLFNNNYTNIVYTYLNNSYLFKIYNNHTIIIQNNNNITMFLVYNNTNFIWNNFSFTINGDNISIFNQNNNNVTIFNFNNLNESYNLNFNNNFYNMFNWTNWITNLLNFTCTSTTIVNQTCEPTIIQNQTCEYNTTIIINQTTECNPKLICNSTYLDYSTCSAQTCNCESSNPTINLNCSSNPSNSDNNYTNGITSYITPEQRQNINRAGYILLGLVVIGVIIYFIIKKRKNKDATKRQGLSDVPVPENDNENNEFKRLD